MAVLRVTVSIKVILTGVQVAELRVKYLYQQSKRIKKDNELTKLTTE